MSPKQGRRCHYCDQKGATTRDHIVPRARGGRDLPWNIVYSCAACNLAKGMQWPTCDCAKCTVAVKLHRERYGIRPGVMRVRRPPQRGYGHA